nr:HmuY family protein [uncultured Flavobacterium sp.]
MKKNFITALFALTALIFTSCSDDDNNTTPETQPVTAETKTYSNLFAAQTGEQGAPAGGTYTKFSFSQNAIVTGDDWDIAFRGTAIIVNGGTAFATDEPARTGQGGVATLSGVLFNEVTTIPAASAFLQDSATAYAIPSGSGNGWYGYNSDTHIITALAGKVFVVKTHDGKYAKMQILSYYKDAEPNPDLNTEYRYYTFKYAYKADDNTTF